MTTANTPATSHTSQSQAVNSHSRTRLLPTIRAGFVGIHRWHIGLLFIVALAFALRILTITPGLILVDRPLVNDEAAYWITARAILDGKLAEDDLLRAHMRVPGYSAIIAASLARFGPRTWPVEIFQGLLGTLSVVLVADLGRRFVSRRARLWAALLIAIQPVLIVYSHSFFIEPVYGFGLLWLVWLLVAAPAQRGRWLWVVLIGASIGLIALIRSQIVFFAVPMALWWCTVTAHRTRSWRRAVAQTALMAATALVVILPWTMRNYRVHHMFLLLDTVGTVNLALDNSGLGFAATKSVIADSSDRLAGRQTFAAQLARERISSHPEEIVSKVPRNLAQIWRPERPSDFELRAKYPGMSDIWLALYGSSKTIWMSIVGVLAILGIIRFPHTRPGSRAFHALIAVLLLAHTCSVAILHTEARYGYPWYPLLAVLAVAGLAQWRWSSATTLAAVVLCGVYLLGSVWPSVKPIRYQIEAIYKLRQGRAAAASGDLDTAVAAYNRAIKLQPTWTGPWLALGDLLAEQDPRAARDAYREAQSARRNDYRAYLILASQAQQQGWNPPPEPALTIQQAGQRAAWLGPAPHGPVIDVGRFDQGAIERFYQAEQDENGAEIRWSGSDARLRLGGLPDGIPLTLDIRVRTMSEPRDQRTLTLSSGGRPVAEIHPSPAWRTYHVLLPDGATDGVAEVTLSMPPRFIQDFIASNDPRSLGVQVDWFSIHP